MKRRQVPSDMHSPIEMGGQALIEGVMMRSQTGYAVALRAPDGPITVRQIPYKPLAARHMLLRLPVVRGAVSLFEMMALGTRALRFSAEHFEAALQHTAPPAPDLPATPGTALRDQAFAATLLLSAAMVLLIVVILPNALTGMLGNVPLLDRFLAFGGADHFSEEDQPLLFNLIAGGIRAVIVLLYVWVISWNRDVRRVFEYHGAEHKAVLAFEDGREVTVARAQAHDTLHPRCGTTFLALVLIATIIAFALADSLIAGQVSGFPGWPFLLRKATLMSVHLALLPLISGVAFEILKACSMHLHNPLCRAALQPGLWFQRMTTRPPSDHMVEVAIVALLAALAIPESETVPHTYVVRGLEDDESAPAYRGPDAPHIRTKPKQETIA